MIRMAIVEDNAEERELLKSHVERCSKERGFLCTVDYYTDGDAIVEGIRTGYDLIVMDIELPLLNGMDAAEQIRTIDRDATIIFVTHNPNYAIRGYKVQALDYLLKPVSYKAFDEVMERALGQRASNDRKYISMTTPTVNPMNSPAPLRSFFLTEPISPCDICLYLLYDCMPTA